MIAAMSNSIDDGRRQVLDMRRNHNSYGLVDGVEVELLRDAGSSVGIVGGALVGPGRCTGREVACLLVDHCVGRCRRAVVEVDTEFYRGQLPVVCMDGCLYGLIIGNDVYKHGAVKYDVQQARVKDGGGMVGMIFGDSKFDQSSAHMEDARSLNGKRGCRRGVGHREVPSGTEAGVRPSAGVDRLTTTRSGVERGVIGQSDVRKESGACVAAVRTGARRRSEAKAPKPLGIKKMGALNISCEEFKQMQKEDEKLEKYWKLADQQQSSVKSKTKFVKNDGILYRIYRDGPHVDPIEQVCS